MKRCIKMKSENNILKTYLQNAIALAQSRKICIFGYQTPALVTYAGLLALNTDIDCFLDFEKGRVDIILFNKQVKDVYSYLSTEKDNCFIIDVSHLRHEFENVISRFDLKTADYYRMEYLFKYDFCDVLDPLLAYSRDGYYPGFRVTGEPDEQDNLRIVILGGSTTDPSYSNLKCWGDFLFDDLNAGGKRCVIYNGGIVGYSSAQERDKFIRDVIPLQPDLLIVFSGVNDIGWNHGFPDKNFYTDYLVSQIVEPVYSVAKEDFESINYGLNCEVKDYENWYNNMCVIRSLSKEFGINCKCILQPSMFNPLYRKDAFEAGWFELLNSSKSVRNKSVNNLTKSWEAFYGGARDLIKGEDCFYDFSDIFRDYSGLYIDGIHCSEKGNKIIAHEIAVIIDAEL